MNQFGCSLENITQWWKVSKYKSNSKWLDPHYHYVYHILQWMVKKKSFHKFNGLRLKSDTFYKYMPITVLGPVSLLIDIPRTISDYNASKLNLGVFFKLTHNERNAIDKIDMSRIQNGSFASLYLLK